VTAPDRPGDRDQQQAREVLTLLHLPWAYAGPIAAALADARADRDRLRQRIEALAEAIEREAETWNEPTDAKFMANRIRAALDAE
jgi:hypothetical protein